MLFSTRFCKPAYNSTFPDTPEPEFLQNSLSRLLSPSLAFLSAFRKTHFRAPSNSANSARNAPRPADASPISHGAHFS